jgi:hypothetical protein
MKQQTERENNQSDLGYPELILSVIFLIVTIAIVLIFKK